MTQLKLAAGIAAAVLVAVVGYNLLPGTPSVGPSIAPSPTVAPTPSRAAPTATPFPCDDAAYPCAGPLGTGEHSSTLFQPKLTFTVDDGWVNSLDRERAYTLHDNFAPAHFFQINSDVAIPEQQETCDALRKEGVGNTVADWVDFLTTHPGLETTEPEPITIGAYDGQRVDLHVAEGWTATCPNSLGPAVFLITDSGTTPDRVRWIDDQYVTMRILDVDGETVILYVESGPSDDSLARVNVALQPTIDTFEFTP